MTSFLQKKSTLQNFKQLAQNNYQAKCKFWFDQCTIALDGSITIRARRRLPSTALDIYISFLLSKHSFVF